MNESVVNTPESQTKPSSRGIPPIPLPMEARKFLIRETESIKRAYKSQENRDTALDMVIDRLRLKYPECFAEEK